MDIKLKMLDHSDAFLLGVYVGANKFGESDEDKKWLMRTCNDFEFDKTLIAEYRAVLNSTVPEDVKNNYQVYMNEFFDSHSLDEIFYMLKTNTLADCGWRFWLKKIQNEV